jgi:hypothetical protein
MRGGDNQYRASLGDSPSSTRVDLAEKEVQRTGKEPQDEVVQPRDHPAGRIRSARHDRRVETWEIRGDESTLNNGHAGNASEGVEMHVRCGADVGKMKRKVAG